MLLILLFLPALALAQSDADVATIPHPDCPRVGTRNIPHEYDCTKYYVCRRGQIEAEPRTCSNRREFSATLRTCVLRSLSGCTLPGHPPTTTPEPTTRTTTTAKPESSTIEVESPPSDEDECHGHDCDEDGSGLPPVDEDHDCSEESDEVTKEDKKCEEQCHVLPWPHDDCDKFWICDGNKAVLIVCAEGLHFNPSTNTCDFTCNAGCVRNKVQATAEHDGLKLYLPWNKIDDNTKSLLKFLTV